MALCCGALVLLAGCGSAGSGQTTRQSFSVKPEPSARAGQLPVPAGRLPTQGPIGLNPARADGVQLDVLSGLLDDTPIYNGDFADPFALRTADDLYIYSSNTQTTQYAPGAHVPVIELARNSGFKGQYLGDALPSLPKWTVSGFQWAPSVWTRPDGTYVMYYSTPATIPLGCLAKAPPSGCVKTTNGESSAMCISRATSANPAGPFVDDSSSAFVCPRRARGCNRPERVRRTRRHAVAALEERRRLLQHAHHDLLPAALGRWALGGWSGPPADRGDPELGGESGRGAVDDRERQHLLALLLGQSLGDGRLRHRRGALCDRRRPLHQAPRSCLALVDGRRGTE